MARMIVVAAVDFAEGAAADAVADFDVVAFDPVLVAAEHVLLKRDKRPSLAGALKLISFVTLPGANVIKLFFLRNLRIFLIS